MNEKLTVPFCAGMLLNHSVSTRARASFKPSDSLFSLLDEASNQEFISLSCFARASTVECRSIPAQKRTVNYSVT